jgi:NTP pyrophosphatase (non-canonical NTP hydrolase)
MEVLEKPICLLLIGKINKNNNSMNKEDIIELILRERRKQDDKWGEQNHDVYKWLAILGEEVGEANKAALEDSRNDLINELIQIGAVTVAMIESLKRNNY